MQSIVWWEKKGSLSLPCGEGLSSPPPPPISTLNGGLKNGKKSGSSRAAYLFCSASSALADVFVFSFSLHEREHSVQLLFVCLQRKKRFLFRFSVGLVFNHIQFRSFQAVQHLIKISKNRKACRYVRPCPTNLREKLFCWISLTNSSFRGFQNNTRIFYCFNGKRILK